MTPPLYWTVWYNLETAYFLMLWLYVLLAGMKRPTETARAKLTFQYKVLMGSYEYNVLLLIAVRAESSGSIPLRW